MGLSIYKAKRAVLRPVIARRRARAASEPPAARRLLEQYGYSKPAQVLMAAKSVDPDMLHRVDLDATSVTFDVGAFLGDGAAGIRRLYGGRVFAFEPNPGVAERLAERFADDPAVSVMPFGLGAKDETLHLALDGPGSSLLGRTHRDWVTTEVQVRDIVAVIEDLGLDRIDLMKINIEGAEYDLLDRLIDAGLLDRVRYLLVQFHEWHDGANLRRWRIRRALRRTHGEVWNYPWIWELWCAESQPHPAPQTFDADEQRLIIEALRMAREGQQVQASAERAD